MNINKLKLWSGALVLFALMPTVSEAYFTTSQHAVQINDKAAMYVITYEFGFADRELYMPILAVRGDSSDTQGLQTGYTLLDGKKVSDMGLMNGIILTDDKNVEVKDNQYYVPAGKSASFTLVALLTAGDNEDISTLNGSILVSHLPFTMVTEDNQTINAQLNESELQYY